MTRTRFLPLAGLLLLGLASRLPGADSPLAAFDNQADVVIRLKNPKATIEKAAEMAAAADEKMAQQVRDNSPFIGVLISNPSLAGVDQEQDWYVVVHAHSEADPSVVFVIPATDADAQQAAISSKMTKFARDGWVFYGEDKAAIEALQGQTSPPADSIVSEIDEDSQAVFDGGDLSIFLNADHLTEVYKDQLDDASGHLAQQLNRQAGVLQMVPGLDLQGTIEGGTTGGADIIKDTRSLTTALSFSDKGLHVETFAHFKEDSKTAQAIADHPGHPLQTISQLPPGAVFYVGLSSSLSQGVESGLAASGSLAEPTDEQQKQLQELEEKLQSVEYQSFALALGLGHRESGLLRIASITEASPTAPVREFKQAAGELMDAELEGQGIKQEADYEVDAEQAGDQSIDVLTVTTTVDPNVNPFFGSIIKQIQGMLLGPEGMVSRFSYWDDKYLYTLGGGSDAMQEAVEAVDSTESNGTTEFREGLIEEPNVIALLDVQRIAYRALKAAAETPELGIPADPALANAEEPAPSYVGFSLVTEPHALRTKTQVPSKQLYRIVQLVIFARMVQQQRD
jgi:hypothetical protein